MRRFTFIQIIHDGQSQFTHLLLSFNLFSENWLLLFSEIFLNSILWLWLNSVVNDRLLILLSIGITVHIFEWLFLL